MEVVGLDNGSLEQACGECGVDWDDNYNDLIDCGEDYYIGGTYGYESRASMCWGYVVDSGNLKIKSARTIVGR